MSGTVWRHVKAVLLDPAGCCSGICTFLLLRCLWSQHVIALLLLVPTEDLPGTLGRPDRCRSRMVPCPARRRAAQVAMFPPSENRKCALPARRWRLCTRARQSLSCPACFYLDMKRKYAKRREGQPEMFFGGRNWLLELSFKSRLEWNSTCLLSRLETNRRKWHLAMGLHWVYSLSRKT